MIGPAAGIAYQNDIESRGDVLVYTTPSLDQDMEVTGPYFADPVRLDNGAPKQTSQPSWWMFIRTARFQCL
jgi:predicted acyl esterase